MEDLTGLKFGKLTVIRKEKSRNSNSMWLCVCECGKERIVRGTRLTNNITKSCGCIIRTDIKGKRFGRLVAIKFHHVEKQKAFWECLCDCGNKKNIRASDLIKGSITSCGCFRNEILLKRVRKHGKSDTSIYNVWFGMKQRCENQNHTSYKNYGGRGIKVCDRWQNFENFYADMGESYKQGLTIERVENNRNYSPDNCEWVTWKKQNNNRRSNRIINLNGVTGTLMSFCEKYDIKYEIAKYRLNKGWSVEKTFSTPVRTIKKRTPI